LYLEKLDLLREELTNALRALIYELFLKTSYGKEIINFLTTFYIFHKSDIKIFLKWFINNWPKDTC